MGSENANEASETAAPAMVLKDSLVAPVFPSLCSNAASGDPCRSTGFYRLHRAWAPKNKQRFLQLFLFPPMPPPQRCPLGVYMAPLDRHDSLVFIGFALRERIWSNLGLPGDLQGSLVCTSPWHFYRAMWPFGHENWLQRDLDTN